MRKLRDIARDLRDEVKLLLEETTLTESTRLFALRLIEDFDAWDKVNKAMTAARKAVNK